MLRQADYSAYIDALVQMGMIENIAEKDCTEWIRLKVPLGKLLLDAIKHGYSEPPEEIKFLPWVSIVMAKTLLEERGLMFAKEDLTGIASIILGFLVESGASGLEGNYRRLVQYQESRNKANRRTKK